MERSDLTEILDAANVLIEKMNNYAPASNKNNEFRADLAGLLVVSISSLYENCIKEIILDYALRHHQQFAAYTSRNYEKLNSKIRVDDLNKLAKLFDDKVHQKFTKNLKRIRQRTERWAGKDIVGSYNQILTCRHSFAHAGERTTTIEEAALNHRIACQVIYAFHKSFSN
ncbi:HEPN domain-containing protein [Pantoea sp. FN060301]|uniref:HEPN domain-containing protein n=1 Tax=Pantoea sp. FN060301 TaxID=3420380 RepID=UPI003D16B280